MGLYRKDSKGVPESLIWGASELARVLPQPRGRVPDRRAKTISDTSDSEDQ